MRQASAVVEKVIDGRNMSSKCASRWIIRTTLERATFDASTNTMGQVSAPVLGPVLGLPATASTETTSKLISLRSMVTSWRRTLEWVRRLQRWPRPGSHTASIALMATSATRSAGPFGDRRSDSRTVRRIDGCHGLRGLRSRSIRGDEFAVRSCAGFDDQRCFPPWLTSHCFHVPVAGS